MSEVRSDLASGSTAVPVVNGIPLAPMTEAELVEAMRFNGTIRSFRRWCRNIGILPVPGRNGIYDPKLVRKRLDEAQNLTSPPPDTAETPPLSLVEQRRVRRGKQSA